VAITRESVDKPGEAAVSRLQWLTLVSAFMGWMFDSADLNLFTVVLVPSVAELIGSSQTDEIAQVGSYIMALKLLCWGLGGIFFGVIADRFGRARTMVVTILIYSVFTGLSGLAQTWGQLAVLQALAGFGIGGEWAAGAALIAETWPQRHRARAMQIMQMAFAFGFFLAALCNLVLGPISWRWVLAAGAAPALISLAIRYYVPEPERWQATRARTAGVRSESFGSYLGTIFSPSLRRRTIVGVLTASAMMIGSWGGLTLLPNWIIQIVRTEGVGNPVQYVSYAFMLMMIGSVFGYLTLIWLTELLGRRGAYFVFCLGALGASAYLFSFVTDIETLLWFMPVYGYFVIGGFGTFALYLPELYPTSVRATGQGFCWNFARVLTAVGPLSVGLLVASFGSLPAAASASTLAYFVGLVAIWFGPETMGRPLEDDLPETAS